MAPILSGFTTASFPGYGAHKIQSLSASNMLLHWFCITNEDEEQRLKDEEGCESLWKDFIGDLRYPKMCLGEHNR